MSHECVDVRLVGIDLYVILYRMTLGNFAGLCGKLFSFFQHVVFFLKSFVDYIIPDRPAKLTAQIKREYYLVQNMLLQAEKDDILSEYGKGMLGSFLKLQNLEIR